MDKTLSNFAIAVQLAGAVIGMVAAVYLARFRYTFIEDLKKLFMPIPVREEDWPITRRDSKFIEENAGREVDLLHDQVVDFRRWASEEFTAKEAFKLHEQADLNALARIDDTLRRLNDGQTADHKRISTMQEDLGWLKRFIEAGANAKD